MFVYFPQCHKYSYIHTCKVFISFSRPFLKDRSRMAKKDFKKRLVFSHEKKNVPSLPKEIAQVKQQCTVNQSSDYPIILLRRVSVSWTRRNTLATPHRAMLQSTGSFTCSASFSGFLQAKIPMLDNDCLGRNYARSHQGHGETVCAVYSRGKGIFLWQGLGCFRQPIKQ